MCRGILQEKLLKSFEENEATLGVRRRLKKFNAAMKEICKESNRLNQDSASDQTLPAGTSREDNSSDPDIVSSSSDDMSRYKCFVLLKREVFEVADVKKRSVCMNNLIVFIYSVSLPTGAHVASSLVSLKYNSRRIV
jgi:hypothetical protein